MPARPACRQAGLRDGFQNPLPSLGYKEEKKRSVWGKVFKKTRSAS
ncbi:MAG: hypothetical protein AAB851_01100 [Patescibacteria group bacterium]